MQESSSNAAAGTLLGTSRRRRRVWARVGRGGAPYALIAPVLLVIGLILGYPLYFLVRLSLQRYGLFELIRHQGVGVGLDNYSSVLHDGVFWRTLLRTVVVERGRELAKPRKIGLRVGSVVDRVRRVEEVRGFEIGAALLENWIRALGGVDVPARRRLSRGFDLIDDDLTIELCGLRQCGGTDRAKPRECSTIARKVFASGNRQGPGVELRLERRVRAFVEAER